MTSPKLICVKCKHCERVEERVGAPVVYCCMHPEFGEREIDIVTGELVGAHRYCSDVRSDEALCGEAGKWFETI